ncbi:MAG: transposase [Selenomonadaceae bacterium]|nr:transposase [Selenomonadaceae bacterium]
MCEGIGKSERTDADNARNGYKSKRVNSSYGNFSVEVPQDRKSIFAPQIIPKRQKNISDIDRKIISIY